MFMRTGRGGGAAQITCPEHATGPLWTHGQSLHERARHTPMSACSIPTLTLYTCVLFALIQREGDHLHRCLTFLTLPFLVLCSNPSQNPQIRGFACNSWLPRSTVEWLAWSGYSHAIARDADCPL